MSSRRGRFKKARGVELDNGGGIIRKNMRCDDGSGFTRTCVATALDSRKKTLAVIGDGFFFTR